MELSARDQERQHRLQALDWMEKALYALEKYDYAAARLAVGVALRHIDEAEGVAHVRAD